MKKSVSTLLLICLLLTCVSSNAFADNTAKPLSFTTLTIDGNEISSEELFRDNQITLVNVWATWCKPCVDELEELSKLHTRLQKRGCGLVGLLWDGDTAPEEGREIAEEKGVNYPIVLPCEEMGVLTELTVFPTTFFVDSEGNLVGEAVAGANPKEYEKTVDALLNKNAARTGASAEAASAHSGNGTGTQNAAAGADKTTPKTSTVDGMMLVCDGDSCWLVPADTSGGTDLQPGGSGETDPAADTDPNAEQDPKPAGEQNPQPGDGDAGADNAAEEPKTETQEEYPTCPIIVLCVSETKLEAYAAGEYAGMDGRLYPGD